jgi:hypothetical protein
MNKNNILGKDDKHNKFNKIPRKHIYGISILVSILIILLTYAYVSEPQRPMVMGERPETFARYSPIPEEQLDITYQIPDNYQDTEFIIVSRISTQLSRPSTPIDYERQEMESDRLVWDDQRRRSTGESGSDIDMEEYAQALEDMDQPRSPPIHQLRATRTHSPFRDHDIHGIDRPAERGEERKQKIKVRKAIGDHIIEFSEIDGSHYSLKYPRSMDWNAYTLPEILLQGVLKLDITDTHISIIPQHQSYAQLRVITMDRSDIPSLINEHSIAFDNLNILSARNMTPYDLTFEGIWEHPQQAGSKIPNLTALYIDKNGTQSRPVRISKYLPNLKILWCSECEFATDDNETTLSQYWDRLEQLNCSSVAFHTDRGRVLLEALPDFPVLTHLRCTHNNLSNFNVNNNLQYLDISVNRQFATLTHNIFMVNRTSLTYLDVSYSKISTLPNTLHNLQYLKCNFTRLRDIPTQYVNLIYLECFDTNITEIPKSLNKLQLVQTNSDDLRGHSKVSMIKTINNLSRVRKPLFVELTDRQIFEKYNIVI